MSHKPKSPAIKPELKKKPTQAVDKKEMEAMIFKIQELVIKDPHKAALILKKILKKAA